MTDPSSPEVAAVKKLYESLNRADHSGAWIPGPRTSRELPQWADELLGRAHLLLGAQEVVYATRANVADGARLAFFTKSTLVVGDVRNIAGETATVSVWVIARSALSKITAADVARVISVDWGLRETWPGSIALELTYSNGEVLKLPSPEPSESGRRELHELLPSLIADLG